MPQAPAVVLTIAGFDPSSGAGVTADIKTIAAHGCYGIAAITALTVQSTAGVSRVSPISAQFLSEMLEELARDFDIAAVKIGMLGSEQVVDAVVDFVARKKPPQVVLDPVLKSSSGADLIDSGGRRLLAEKLFPLSQLVSPNVDEASVLTGCAVTNPEQMKSAALKLHAMGAANVVVTGGHLDKAIDLLSFATRGHFEQQLFKAERQRSASTHGTGCAFSTAVACHLACGRGVPEAVLLAKAYVSAAIAKAQSIGRGTGPVHHLYRLNQRQRRDSSADREVINQP
ncbi:MAG: bifunctional hydroxymethylpyrimidine kinase/phosphomethylpyrimidine kinase [Acidobacteria bacterium]|nr:bifunctional hydroxymethylpyrimidine kinase/phosphomethylpyrimidine kinase [Acidobacteriota bacterium]